MRVCVVGAGYVGLVTGACLAGHGHSVICVDSDREKIDGLLNGRIPIFEPGLDNLVVANLTAERLSFSSDLAGSSKQVDVVCVAVGTPPRECDGWPDISAIHKVAREIAPTLSDDTVVVLKSTAPVGTSEEVERILRECRPGLDASVVSNPEFLRAGSALRDFEYPERIIVGTDEPWARHVLAELYAPFTARGAQLLFTSRQSSELIKYSANALLATKIAFINEVADLCERIDANVRDVAHAIGLDPRIGPGFLEAGPGFGGSCFRKDALALARLGEAHERPMRIVEAVLQANESRKRALLRKIAAALGRPLRGATIALLGLTFKANTDDMREAPSITLVSALLAAGASVRAYDPAGAARARLVLPPDVLYASDAYEAAQGADAAVVMTEWPEFRALDLKRLRRCLATPLLIDLRNLYEPHAVTSQGIGYWSIGAAGSASVSRVRHDNTVGVKAVSNGSHPDRQIRIAKRASAVTSASSRRAQTEINGRHRN